MFFWAACSSNTYELQSPKAKLSLGPVMKQLQEKKAHRPQLLFR